MSVLSTSLSSTHNFSKTPSPRITLLANLGVQGDAHLGKTVQHVSRLKIQPAPPNLRQVHLIPLEILTPRGVKPGEIGENITTRGIDLLKLSTGTRVHFLPATTAATATANISAATLHIAPAHPVVKLTGLRNPCPQIDKFRAGLKEKFMVRDEARKIVGRLAGVMGTVEVGGAVEPGMRIVVVGPREGQAGFVKLEPV